MKNSVVVLATLLLVGCQEGRPDSCAVARQNFDVCSRDRADLSAVIANCLPHTLDREYAGIYASAFEFDSFRERETSAPADLWKIENKLVTLDFASNENPLYSPGRAQVWQVEFHGYRPPCDIEGLEDVVIVSRLTKSRLLRDSAAGVTI